MTIEHRASIEQPVFDRGLALVSAQGNEQALNEMILSFLSTAPKRMDEIHGAVESREPRRIERAAGAFKGSLTWVGAPSAAAAAARLESIGKSTELCEVETAFADLTRELGRLSSLTSKLLAEQTASTR